MKQIAFVRPDGGVSVVTLAPKARRVARLVPPASLPDAAPLEVNAPFHDVQGYVKGGWTVVWAETEDEYVTRHQGELETIALENASRAEAEGQLGQAASLRETAAAVRAGVHLDTLPSRAYRDAWMLSGGKVQHDMAKARTAKLAEIREERNKRLAATDGIYLRAQEAGDTAELNRLKTARQRLRDLPATVALDHLPDADALKAFEPNWP